MDKTKIDSLLKVNLLEKLGLGDISEEEKISIIQDATTVVMKGTWIKVFERLSEEKQNELSEMLENDDPAEAEKVIEFIRKEVPDFKDVFKEEVAKYKDIILSK